MLDLEPDRLREPDFGDLEREPDFELAGDFDPDLDLEREREPLLGRERERDRLWLFDRLRDIEREPEREREGERLPLRLAAERERDLDRDFESSESLADLMRFRSRFPLSLLSLSLLLFFLLFPPASLSDSLVEIVAFERNFKFCFEVTFSLTSLAFFFWRFSFGRPSRSLSLS